eukprot:4077551-Pleurochrysis_carterae.AAC.2
MGVPAAARRERGVAPPAPAATLWHASVAAGLGGGQQVERRATREPSCVAGANPGDHPASPTTRRLPASARGGGRRRSAG